MDPLLQREWSLLKWLNKCLTYPSWRLPNHHNNYTRWLAHERRVNVVKASYGAIVTALKNIHENTHKPEALGLYIVDYVVPQMAKLSRTLQTEHFDLSVVSSLLNATLHTLDDSVLLSANWLLELLDECKLLRKQQGSQLHKPLSQLFRKKWSSQAIYHTPEREHF